MTQIDVKILKTAVGWFRIEAFAGELTRVDLFTELEPVAESASTVLQGAVQQLQAYLDGSLQRFYCRWHGAGLRDSGGKSCRLSQVFRLVS